MASSDFLKLCLNCLKKLNVLRRGVLTKYVSEYVPEVNGNGLSKNWLTYLYLCSVPVLKLHFVQEGKKMPCAVTLDLNIHNLYLSNLSRRVGGHGGKVTFLLLLAIQMAKRPCPLTLRAWSVKLQPRALCISF